MAGFTLAATGHTAAGASLCRTGVIRRAEEIGFIQRGTHRLFDRAGNLIASLASAQVNLFALEGRFVTVCGTSEGVIEGVLAINVTQALPAAVPGMMPPPQPQPDLRLLLLLLLLTQPGLFRTIRPELLLFLLLGRAF